MPFSAHTLKNKNNSLTLILWWKTNGNVYYRSLYSYRRHHYSFPKHFFSRCFCLLSEFAKGFERKIWRVQVAHFHNAAHATKLKNDCACVTSDPVGEAVAAKISTLAVHFEWKTLESLDFAVKFQLVYRYGCCVQEICLITIIIWSTLAYG